uniref:Uncharacterized protein n=2 Tax=Bos TaxID=9903 RepID=B6VAE5_BOVIN|nr:hypothetical protein [Bos taurus]
MASSLWFQQGQQLRLLGRGKAVEAFFGICRDGEQQTCLEVTNGSLK